MLRNYIKIAFRNLFRNKLYTTVNVLGLTLSAACVILIALYIMDELTYDRFHSQADQIFRVVEERHSEEQGDQKVAAVAFKISGAAEAEFPEVERTAMFTEMGRIKLQNEENEESYYQELLIAEPETWEIFNFPLLAGDPATVLREPNTVVLSEELAQKLFGEENPIGKTLITDREINLTVDGVLAPVPSNSHLQFTAMASHTTLKQYDWYSRIERTDWSSNYWLTYLKLKPETDPTQLAGKLTDFVNSQREGEDAVQSTFHLQPLTDIHFYSQGIESDRNEGKGSLSYIYLFGAVGFFILLIGCINYMNLATARASMYAKEVGIRKVAGAGKRSLVGRFFSESLLLCLLSFIIATYLVSLVLPAFNTYTGKDLSIYLSGSGWLLPLLLGILVSLSFLSGLYPSIYLSRFKPVVVLRGKIKAGKEGFNLRKGLVVFQFVLSIIMITGTLVVFSQMKYIQNKDLGFNEDQLVVVDINSGVTRQGFQTIKEGYAQLAAVKDVSVSSRVPGEWKVMPQVEVRTAGKQEREGPMAYYIAGDSDFLRTFQIDLLAGRNFDADRPADSTAVLINEKAAAMLGIDNADGQRLHIPAFSFDGNKQALEQAFDAKVIGIVKDFHFQSLHEGIEPLVVAYRNNPIHSIDYFTVRLDGRDVEQTLTALGDILHSVDPNQIFEYHFLDKQLQLFYEADQRRGQIFSAAALFAIFIACLGLFGLAAFTAEQRTKEIGIRKVLGATVSDLMVLLSKDFLSLVLIALLIAAPLGWYASHRWLDGFAYHVAIHWWMLILPGVAAILIALLTVSYQSLKAASNNPVESLRYE